MNIQYLDIAKTKVPNIPLLINLVSRRVRQLNAGQRPLVKPDNPQQANLDIALKEVAEEKISAEIIEADEVEASTEESLLGL